MPYTVFALKWRPKNFDELVGQPHIVGNLTSAIEKKRIANAYLFAGPRGVGKTSAARIFAKALNCKQGPTLNPCQKCPSCLEIAAGRSLDVIEIDGASNRGIDEIRVLRENVKFAPVQGKYKIYIIDEVHQITADGFNALLKTLEEPPEFVKFIFATTHPHKVIPTILSRCQRFDFHRIKAVDIANQLEHIASAEKIKVDKEVLFAIARSSDGSLRDAESVLDQLFSFSGEKILLKDVISVLGLVEEDALFALTDKVVKKDPAAVVELLNVLFDEGKDSLMLLNSFIEHFRNLMVAKVAQADPKLIDLSQDTCERLLEQSKALSLEEIFNAFNVLLSASEMAKRFDSARIPLEISLVRLALKKHAQPTEAKPQAHPVPPAVEPPQAKAPLQARYNPPSEEKKEVTPAPCDVSLDDVKNIWQNLIAAIAKVKMSMATYLAEGQPVKMQGNALTVTFAKNRVLNKESLEEKTNRALIEKSLSILTKAILRVKFVLSEEESAPLEGSASVFVNSALNMFGGRIVKES